MGLPLTTFFEWTAKGDGWVWGWNGWGSIIRGNTAAKDDWGRGDGDGGLGHRFDDGEFGGVRPTFGDGMVVSSLMVGVLGDGMVDKEGVRYQILIDGLLEDEEDGMDHPSHPK
ncbi:hypothetical protein QVD17_03436 [Tagetes erecta]|uniref:Uncharacterized protein n=1 Tax=Tagetes erecta TaxID=13708 RepID=A0AAD8P9X3_TARER|nr:hypothetical protein QVD17_03436 [Tagetes erecta]